MSEPFVHIQNLKLKFRNQTILEDLCWTINRGEQWLLRGASGSGKTSLAKVISGRIQTNVQIKINCSDTCTPKVLYVAQWYQFKDKQGTSNFYYQQRYNSLEAEESDTVRDELSKLNKAPQDTLCLLERFHLLDRKDAPLLQLSSGEHKKLQLCRVFLLKPQLLILDNPYTGLDVATRRNLNTLIDQSCREEGMQLILISNDGEEPSCINRFAQLVEGRLEILPTKDAIVPLSKIIIPKLPAFLKTTENDFDEMVKLRDVNIKYGKKQILTDINWTVNKGDKWLLQGHNGSGKSTLLSLLTADNPQAYANEIWLFGRRRGTGESIWDIKKNIGFISPELQWYFEPSSSVFQAIASGLFDTNGLFRAVNRTQTEKVEQLLSLFGLEEEAHNLLKQLPLGKQRLVLLARAIIKNPPLLILDEPCQGLDEQQTILFNNLVDAISTENRTLIYVGHFEYRLPNCITNRLTLDNGSMVNNKLNEQNNRIGLDLK